MPLAAGAGIAVGVARGGRLSSMADVQLRGWPLLGGAVALQLSLGSAPGWLRFPLVLACIAASATWALRNASALPSMRLGLALVAAGVVLNGVVIAANGGMPVALEALPLAGLDGADVTDGFLFKHVPMSGDTALRFLGDVIPVAVKPFRSVISVGDIVMLAGIALTSAQATFPLQRTMAVQA